MDLGNKVNIFSRCFVINRIKIDIKDQDAVVQKVRLIAVIPQDLGFSIFVIETELMKLFSNQ